MRRIMSWKRVSNAIHGSVHELVLVSVIVGLSGTSVAQSCTGNQHPTFRISVAPALAGEPLSGRLIVMMSNQLGPKDDLAPSFGPDARSVWLAAKEVHDLTAEKSVELDPDELAFPDAHSAKPRPETTKSEPT